MNSSSGISKSAPSGKGLWPAFWLLPSSRESKPEIDVMEVLGHRTTALELHFHYKDAAGKTKSAGTEVIVDDLSAGWHIYGCDWTADKIVWYLDGREVWRYTRRDFVPREPMYLILNLAVGGKWPGKPDTATAFPTNFDIDYVRVWQGRGR
jgi:beta-glucanase (GH16 family)